MEKSCRNSRTNIITYNIITLCAFNQKMKNKEGTKFRRVMKSYYFQKDIGNNRKHYLNLRRQLRLNIFLRPNLMYANIQTGFDNFKLIQAFIEL